MSDCCPHCAGNHNDRAQEDFTAMCADREPWTQRERDTWRAQVRRRDPAAQFVDSYPEQLISRINAGGRS